LHELTFSPKEAQDGENYSVHRLILGTHTSKQATDQLMIAEVLLPKGNADAGKEVTELYDEDRQGESDSRRA
jgi:histone-binding protein RBBP4